MWVRVVRGQVDPASVDEAIQVSQDVAAAIRRLPGNQSYILGGDRSTGRSVTISTWDTEEHAKYSAAEVMADVVAKFRALGIQPDPPEFYEVIVS